MEYLMKLKTMLHRELADLTSKGDLTAGVLETSCKIVEVLKNIEKIEKMEREEYSNSYDGGNSYDGYSTRHYVRGHYSRDGYARDGYSNEDYSRASKEEFEMKLRRMLEEGNMSPTEREAALGLLNKMR